MIRAAITPGIQPQRVKIKTIKTEPQPLSITARGGNKIESNTLQKFIFTKLRLISTYWSEDVPFVTAIDLQVDCRYLCHRSPKLQRRRTI